MNLTKNVTGEQKEMQVPHPGLDIQLVRESTEEAASSIADGEVIASNSSVFGLADRFIEVFEAHDVHRNEIPILIPKEFGVTYQSLSHVENIIGVLQPELIDWVCATFGIRRDWLVRNEQPIYDTRRRDYYNNGQKLLGLLKDLRSQHREKLEVYIYKDVKELNSQDERRQHVNILLTFPAASLGDKVINRYVPTSTLWDWGYERSRYQLKGVVRVCCQRNLYFSGYNLSSKAIEELSGGRIFPKKIIDEVRVMSWRPDYYTDTASESMIAREVEEIEAVIEHIKERRYSEAFPSVIL